MMDQCLSGRDDTVAHMPRTVDTVDVLKRVMTDHNVNQSEFALEAGVSYVTVNRWLNRRTELTEKKLAAVLREIGIEPASYGLQGRKLPRLTDAERIDRLFQELAAMEERARLRHDELLKVLRDIRLGLPDD